MAKTAHSVVLSCTIAWLTSGCREVASLHDLDGDGVEDAADCAPEDPDVFPGNDDPYGNGIDSDCDTCPWTAAVGAGDGIDRDCDGYPSNPEENGEAWYDCDDSNTNIHPGAEELPNDGIDQDCSGADAVDSDGDGHTAGNDDCDDDDPDVYPGAEEQPDGQDNDCDGTVDEGTRVFDDDDDGSCEGFDLDGDSQDDCSDGSEPGDCDDGDPSLNLQDLDGDGWDTCDGDCDDAEPAVNPGAAEVACDSIDDNCDGVLHDDEVDDDSDGYTECDGDCNDADAAIHPGATEVACDAIDNDCDGVPHDDEVDDDSDGYTECDGDCNDGDQAVFPGAIESCNGVDDNCDGVVDQQGLCGQVDLSAADAKLVGEDEDDHAGLSLSSAGDVNGDGYDDVLVGAHGHDAGGSNAGAAYLVLGPISGTVDLANADAKLVGEQASDEAGVSVSSAGDVDADGYDDILVGADGQDTGGSNAGAAYLVLGPVSGTVDLADADAIFNGEEAIDCAGVSVSSAGDVNADGYADILVGASGYGNGTSRFGAAYLLLGPATGTIELSNAEARLVGEDGWDEAGKPVSSAGDVNGDGAADILVGARYESAGGSNAGAAYLVLGSVSGHLDLSAADAKLVGEDEDDYAGLSVSSAGDNNGDGFDDLLVGAYGQDAGGTEAGAAYLVLGPVSGTVDLASADAKLVGEAGWNYVGDSVSSAGDVNADGYDDLLVGATGQDAGGAGAGAAYLVLGPAAGTVDLANANAKLVGEVALDEAGLSVSSAGDVNADGYDDILVGARMQDAGGMDAGAVYLVLGGP